MSRRTAVLRRPIAPVIERGPDAHPPSSPHRSEGRRGGPARRNETVRRRTGARPRRPRDRAGGGRGPARTERRGEEHVAPDRRDGAVPDLWRWLRARVRPRRRARGDPPAFGAADPSHPPVRGADRAREPRAVRRPARHPARPRARRARTRGARGCRRRAGPNVLRRNAAEGRGRSGDRPRPRAPAARRADHRTGRRGQDRGRRDDAARVPVGTHARDRHPPGRGARPRGAGRHAAKRRRGGSLVTLAHQATLIARKDLLIEVRGRHALGTLVPFAATVLVSFGFAFGPGRDVLERVAPGLLWMAVLFAAVLASRRAYQTESEDGALEGHLLAPID